MTTAVRPAGDSPDRPETLVVIGQGYVGLPLALAAVDAGFSVVGFDTDDGPDQAPGRPAVSYVEDISDETLAGRPRHRPLPAHLRRRRLRRGSTWPSSTCPHRCETASPIWPTWRRPPPCWPATCAPGPPSSSSRRPTRAPPRSSSVPSWRRGRAWWRATISSSATAPNASTPATPPGTSISTPKVVSGIDAGSLDAVAGFYGRIVDDLVPVSGTREAELVKLLENTFRHVNVALVNELAMFAGDLGIDIWEAIERGVDQALRLHALHPRTRRGRPLPARRPSYLSWAVRRTLGESFRFVELANDVNAHMPDYVVRRLVVAFNRLGQGPEGFSGAACSASPTRPTPAMPARPRGPSSPSAWPPSGAEVRVADPHLAHDTDGPLHPGRAERRGARRGRRRGPRHRPRAPSTTSLVTTHARYVLDTRGRLDGPHVERL